MIPANHSQRRQAAGVSRYIAFLVTRPLEG